MTERVLIPRRDDSAEPSDPGPWWWPIALYAAARDATPADMNAEGDRPARAIVACPDGHRATLRHEVAADGMVSPSIQCPVEGCTWHIFGRLDGWP